MLTSDQCTKEFEDEVESFLDFIGATQLGSNDVFIAVMGMTGSGKSTFISRCTNHRVEIGHGLHSCTQKISIYTFQYGMSRVHLIDTPGFDDTNRSDIETLKEISNYFSVSYHNKVYISGIIYLQRISDNRLGNSGTRNIEMFKALCGAKAWNKVFVVTTMWPKRYGNHSAAYEEYLSEAERERQLGEGIWAEVLAGGGSLMRHETDSRGSALQILDEVLSGPRGEAILAIQTEMVDQNLTLDQTTAGMVVNRDLSVLRDRLMKDLENTTQKMHATQAERDFQMTERLKLQEQDFKNSLEASRVFTDDLRLSLEDLCRESERKVLAMLDETESQLQVEVYAKEHEVQALKERIQIVEDELKTSQNTMGSMIGMEIPIVAAGNNGKPHSHKITDYRRLLDETKAELRKMNKNMEVRKRSSMKVKYALGEGNASCLKNEALAGAIQGITQGLVGAAATAAIGALLCCVM
ncbi:hypothetical protein EG329_004231 [Mollisiaceae sp. DMI_Dod_QoI]|nr:hypothetical protein EG329_004231 [Helotiales sp. DMI_Dod_QoI]